MAITSANLILLSLFQSAVAFYLFPQFLPARSLFFVLSVINLSVLAVYRLILYPFFLTPFKHLPTARGFTPIIGHTLALLKSPSGDPHLRLIKTTPNHGLIRTWGLFHTEPLIATTPEALADVLVHNSYDFEKPAWIRDFLRKFLGNGLVISEGEEHKHARKQIMPAFHFRHIRDLYPVFWAKSLHLCSTIKAVLGESQAAKIEICQYATQVTLDIMGIAGLGRDLGSLQTGTDELYTYYHDLLAPTKEKIAYFIMHVLLPPWLIAIIPWKLSERISTTRSHLRRICREFVAEKKLKMKQQGQTDRDILSIMIASDSFSDENLTDQLVTFLAAGHETTSTQLTWALYLFSQHQDVQTRLRAEVHHSIPNPKDVLASGNDIAALLENMPYLNAVCNEVLRLFPVAAVTTRVAVRDTTVIGQFIPKGTVIYVVPWATNRSADLWGPNSEDFVPERWIDKETGRATMNGTASSHFSFLTFLHGPHSCIGEKFARAELRALLATLVGSFEMEMAEPGAEIKLEGILISKPKDGMHLKLTPLPWCQHTP